MSMSEIMGKGKVGRQGKYARTIPFSSFLSEMMGGVEIGDRFEWHKEGERLYLVFPDRKAMTSDMPKGPEKALPPGKPHLDF